MYGRSTMLVQGGMLLLFVGFFLFSPLQLSICAAVLSCSSCHHTSTHPTWKQAPGQLLSHSLSPVAEGLGPFVSHSRHNNTNSSPITARAEPTCFWGFRLKLWHLSYTCIQTPLGLNLAQGLRQLYRYYVCTILTNCLCCLCFPEPGVVFECSAVSLRFLFLLFLLHLLLQFRETIHLGLSINPVTVLLIGVVAPWLLISPVPALIPNISPKTPKPNQACTHATHWQLASPHWKNTWCFLLTCLQLTRVLRSTSDNQKFSLNQERKLCSECKKWQRSPEKTTD